MKALILAFIIISIQQVPSAFACAVCFGDPNSPLTQGVGLGIWTLMGFIGGVLALFSILFWNIRCRMKKFSTAQ